MEMDVVQVNHNWSCIKDESVEQSFPSKAPGLCDACRDDPELHPRIGDEYQVGIPPLMAVSSYLFMTGRPADGAILSGTSHDFLVGLPISLMWINEDVENIKLEQQEGFDNWGTGVGKSANLHLQQEIKNEIHQMPYGGKGYHLVPGSANGTWSDLEEAIFLLGLYIFGKNLIRLKKFVETKSMGDILAYYYGKFYRSDRYIRWSECRKMRSKRCVYGERLFTGSRQQELLARLLPQVSQECQTTLLEIAKAFREERMPLEDYVFTLKAKVGLNALVEAVGIGKGKQDLTSFVMETPKSSQVAPARPEIPVGKACSTLTPLEIINFLTGGYRLSKARSNDLFWEAVWPRLLARGWHSEQPNDYNISAASRQSLVFLIPGIRKFSRRKLAKGDHYFDSVSDVLNKVALNPELLELDGGTNKNEENILAAETNVKGDFLDQQRHCYLKPRNPSHNTNAMKFTIVDTSLVNGERAKVRELRSLTFGMKNISTSRNDSDESDGHSSEDSTDGSDNADNLYCDGNKTSTSKSAKINFYGGISSGGEYYEDTVLKRSLPINGSCFSKVSVRIPKDQKARKAMKGNVIGRTKAGDRNLIAKSQQKSTACDLMDTSRGTIDVLVGPRLKQCEVACAAVNVDMRDNFVSHVDRPGEKLSSTSCASWGSPNVSDEWILSSNSSGAIRHHEIPQSRTMIDLNLPISQDVEIEPVMMKVAQTSKSVCDLTTEQPPNMNSRRHSTRNRPPTTKALEAFACGFLTVKQKRKSRDEFSLQSSTSRPSRCTRSRMTITKDITNGTTHFRGDEIGDGAGKSNADSLSMVNLSVINANENPSILGSKIG